MSARRCVAMSLSMKPYQVLKTISQFIVSFSTNLTAEKKVSLKTLNRPVCGNC